MKTEVKVGAFTLLGVVLLIGIMALLNGVDFQNKQTYDLKIGFPQAIGLTAGNDVCYAGVRIGKVQGIEPAGKGVIASVTISEGIGIPKQSTVIVASNGVMGGKFINITPNENADIYDCYAPGDFLYGTQEATMDSMMENMNTAVLKVQGLLDSLNAVLGDQETQKALKDVSLNLKNITANVDQLTGVLANMAAANQGDLRQMAQNLNQMTGSLMRTADNLEVLVATFNGDGTTGKNLKEAIANLSTTSKRIDNMAAALEGTVTDPQTQEDLKVTLHNVRNVTARADKMLGSVGAIETEAGLETMYSGKEDRWQTGLDVNVYPDQNTLLRLGLNDIGEDNNINFQGGFRQGLFGARAGVIESKAGLGVDLGSKKLNLSVDGYDPNDFRLKSRLQYEIAKDTYIFTQVNDINNSDKRATYFGLRRSF